MSDSAEVPQARGPRQREIVDVLAALNDDHGLKTADIANQIHMEVPNAYLTLQALADQGLVEQVPGEKPQRWRLMRRFRLSQRIVDIVGLLREGEWTTYGDISELVYGHSQGGLAVGQVVSRRPECAAAAHRVLENGGRVPAAWRDNAGQGMNECVRLLHQEGVAVEDGRAEPGAHVDHVELGWRLDAKQLEDAAKRTTSN